MSGVPTQRPIRRLLAAILIAASLGGAPAMTWAHAAGSMPGMAAGTMPAPHSVPHHHDPLASCCDLCAIACVSAPAFGTVALPAVAANVSRFSIDRPVPLPAAVGDVRLLPPAVGPPARA